MWPPWSRPSSPPPPPSLQSGCLTHTRAPARVYAVSVCAGNTLFAAMLAAQALTMPKLEEASDGGGLMSPTALEVCVTCG
jgi:hypothetical protein